MQVKQAFRSGFLWGASTSAYQVEGSPLADGAGPSIWHRFERTKGMIRNGDTGAVASDHYRRMPGDVQLMEQLGLNAYRFSIAWSRVLPQGRGKVNQAGLDFYQRLVDTLLEAEITPMATLFHWDLPAALDDRGGWLNPDIAHWFADYAQQVFSVLDDRIPLWATLNEPWVVTDGGYLHGTLAPGHRNLFEAPLASHNLLRAHAMAVQAYRAQGQHQIGLVVNLEPKYPATDTELDLAACARAEAYMNRQYLDPVFLQCYPPQMKEIFGDAWPHWPDEDFKLIAQPLDFLGVNYYTRSVTQHAPQQWPVGAERVRQNGAIYTETDWEVFPQGLTDTLLWVRQQYGDIPLYITENGAAFYDPPSAIEGRVDDPLRVSYLNQHIDAVAKAVQLGVDIRGYFAWSLLDNLEWAHGFSKRFGLIHVDYANQQRTLKASAHAYTARILKEKILAGS